MPHTFRPCWLRRHASLAHFRVHATASAILAALLAAPASSHAQTPPAAQTTAAASLDEMWDADLPATEEEGGLALEADEEEDDDGNEDTLLAVAEEEDEEEEGSAWTGDDEDGPLYELAALTVQGAAATDYTPVAPAAVGGPMGLTIKETAQAVSVVTEQRIKDQGLVTARDVMKWVPGVNLGSSPPQESFSANARGFSINNVMIDGQSIGGTGSISNDLSLYESVEVLRGAAGLFAGSGADGSPGGAVSLTRKKPTRKPQLKMATSAGSWDNYTASVDASGPLVESGRLRARGIASWIDRKFHYDYGWRKSHTLGLSLDLDVTPDTLLSVGADMEDRSYISGTHRYAFWNWDWTVAELGDKNRSNLMPWGQAKRKQRSAFVKLDHVFVNDWNIKLNYTRTQYTLKTDYTHISSQFDGDTKQLEHYLDSTWDNSKNWDEAAGMDFTGAFKLFGQEHKFVLGYNYQSNWSRSISVPGSRERRDNNRRYGYERGIDNWDEGLIDDGYHRVIIDDFDNMDYSQYAWRPNAFETNRVRLQKPNRQSGVYANLRLKLLDSLALTGGARISRYQRDGRDNTWENPRRVTGVDKQTNVFTPFWAISYDFNEQHTAHLSHAEIFKTQNYYGLDGEYVDPLTGENLELGLKSDWNDGRLTTSVSVYKLDQIGRTWRAIISPCPIVKEKHGIEAACYVADRHQRVIGVDFELIGQLTDNWNVSVGASWLKTKYISWTNTGGATSSSQGQSWGNSEPRKQLKIWSMYQLPGVASKWRVGVGMQMQDKSWSNYSSNSPRGLTSGTRPNERPGHRIVRPGYTQWDAMVAWDISKTWQAQLNVDNLTNKRYHRGFSSVYIYLNEPRSFNLSLTGRFQ